MTGIFTVEITAELDDETMDAAEKAILNPVKKAMWERKLERALEERISKARVNCTDIKVFMTS